MSGALIWSPPPFELESSLHQGPDDFVFCKNDGSALDPDVLRKDALYPILDRLGIPRKNGAPGFTRSSIRLRVLLTNRPET